MGKVWQQKPLGEMLASCNVTHALNTHPPSFTSMPLLSASLPKGQTELHWHWRKLSNINTISRDTELTFFIYNKWSLWLVGDGLHILILKNKCWRWSENVATPHKKKQEMHMIYVVHFWHRIRLTVWGKKVMAECSAAEHLSPSL